jgi:ABC-type sugar transport system ATPase subunit
MTVETNIGFPLAMRKQPRDVVAARVRDVAQLLGLTPHLRKYPDQLSGGQRQRVALGRAIIREPVAFLMDEPLSNLDALLRVQMRTELLQLHRRVGRTTIYVTHDQVEAMTMADRIVVMRDGLIEQIGPPAEVYAHPATTFVATFVGSPPMNLLNGHVVPGPNGRRFAGAVSWTGTAGFGWPVEGPATLGIRPEHIHLVPQDTPDSIPGTVMLVEDVGADAYISVSVGPQLGVWVRTSAGSAVEEGRQVGLVFDASHVRWFDEAGVRRQQEGS